VPCQKRWHLTNHPHNILHVITKNNNLLKLQNFLKHDNFFIKPIKINENVKRYYFSQKIKPKMKYKDFCIDISNITLSSLRY
jgi:hypothetical protein